MAETFPQAVARGFLPWQGRRNRGGRNLQLVQITAFGHGGGVMLSAFRARLLLQTARGKKPAAPRAHDPQGISQAKTRQNVDIISGKISLFRIFGLISGAEKESCAFIRAATRLPR